MVSLLANGVFEKSASCLANIKMGSPDNSCDVGEFLDGQRIQCMAGCVNDCRKVQGNKIESTRSPTSLK